MPCTWTKDYRRTIPTRSQDVSTKGNAERQEEKLKLYSHPRSGTNWALALLSRAFTGSVILAPAKTGHWSNRIVVKAPKTHIRGGHQFYNKTLQGPRLYIYRDGRDVAYSLWRTKAFQNKQMRNLSFSAFLRTPIDWYATPGRKTKKRWTIVQHWLRHVESWKWAADSFFFRYEDLLLDPIKQLFLIEKFTGQDIVTVDLPVSGMGPFPSGQYRVSKWREVFSNNDLDYFFKIVPKNHWGLYKDG